MIPQPLSGVDVTRAETCEWREDADGNWDSACDEKWSFIDGGPAENCARFCHGCGGRLVAVPYVDPFDDVADGETE